MSKRRTEENRISETGISETACLIGGNKGYLCKSLGVSRGYCSEHTSLATARVLREPPALEGIPTTAVHERREWQKGKGSLTWLVGYVGDVGYVTSSGEII